MRSASAQHRGMLAAVFGTVFLVFFALSPLRWVEFGMPWLTLVITFVLIPLLDAAVQMVPGLIAALQDNFRQYQESFAPPKGPTN